MTSNKHTTTVVYPYGACHPDSNGSLCSRGRRLNTGRNLLNSLLLLIAEGKALLANPDCVAHVGFTQPRGLSLGDEITLTLRD